MTLMSVLRFVPFWLKYMVIPEPLRFVWWLIWSRFRVVEHRVHRHLVLEGEAANAMHYGSRLRCTLKSER